MKTFSKLGKNVLNCVKFELTGHCELVGNLYTDDEVSFTLLYEREYIYILLPRHYVLSTLYVLDTNKVLKTDLTSEHRYNRRCNVFT